MPLEAFFPSHQHLPIFYYALQTAASDLPVIGQVANGVSYLQNELGSAINTFKNIYETFEDEFCTAAYYTPPTDVPANLTGAHKEVTRSGICHQLHQQL